MAWQVLWYWTYLQRTHPPGALQLSVEVGNVKTLLQKIFGRQINRSIHPKYAFILLSAAALFGASTLATAPALRADSISHARAENIVVAVNSATELVAQNAQAWAAVNRPAHRNASRVTGPLSNIAQFNRTAGAAGESAAENASEPLLLLVAGCFSLLAYQGLRRYNAATSTEK